MFNALQNTRANSRALLWNPLYATRLVALAAFAAVAHKWKELLYSYAHIFLRRSFNIRCLLSSCKNNPLLAPCRMWSAGGQTYNDQWGGHQNGYGHQGVTSSSANYAGDPKRPSAYHSQSLPRNVGRRKAGAAAAAAARGQQWSQDDFGANYGYHAANGAGSTWDYGHGRGKQEKEKIILRPWNWESGNPRFKSHVCTSLRALFHSPLLLFVLYIRLSFGMSPRY